MVLCKAEDTIQTLVSLQQKGEISQTNGNTQVICPISVENVETGAIPTNSKNSSFIIRDICLSTLYVKIRNNFFSKKRDSAKHKELNTFYKDILNTASENSIFSKLYERYKQSESEKGTTTNLELVGPPTREESPIFQKTNISNAPTIKGSIYYPLLNAIATVITNNDNSYKECSSDRCGMGIYAVTPFAYIKHRLGDSVINITDNEVNTNAALQLMRICGKKNPLGQVKDIIACYLGSNHKQAGNVINYITKGGN